MSKEILFIIPARGGSKGIPRKNLRSLLGKPLIYYSIDCVLKIPDFSIDCYVTTDDDEIELISNKFGSKVVRRDNKISDDHTTLDPVIYHAYTKIKKIENKKYDAVVTVQPTSPLLETRTLKKALDYFFEANIDTLISGINDSHLTWSFVNDSFIPNYEKRVNRQLLPEVYKETGGFVITKPSFISINSRFGNEVKIFPVSKKESVDIDSFEDWNLCDYYLRRKFILFVVAGNSKIGLGHVYNTLSIANEILDHRVEFLVLEGSQMAHEKINEFNYKVYCQNQKDLASDILKINPDIVINDILDTSFSYIEVLNKKGIKTINFEDLGKGSQIADVVINAMYPENKIVLNHYYGSKYFILRDEFQFSNEVNIQKEVKRILISFGGVDPNNYTERVLRILEENLNPSFEVTVVTGMGYKNSTELKKKFPDADIKVNINNISDEISKADIVFTSAGRTTFEVASIGVPCIVLCQNERESTHFFASEKNGFYNLGLGYKVSDADIQLAFENVCKYEVRQLMNSKMTKNKLKKGKERVIRIIKDILRK